MTLVEIGKREIRTKEIKGRKNNQLST
jgi:hypothetical protein